MMVVPTDAPDAPNGERIRIILPRAGDGAEGGGGDGSMRCDAMHCRDGKHVY